MAGTGTVSEAQAAESDVGDRGPLHRLKQVMAGALTVGAIAWALDLYRLAGMALYTEQYIAAMYAVALTLAFLHLPARRGGPRQGRPPPWDMLAAAAAFASGWYLAIRYPLLVDMILLRPTDAVVVSVILILLSLEALRRATGTALFVIVVVFIAYALLAHMVPGQLAGRSTDWPKLAAYLAIDVNGLLGIPLTAACTIVAAFIFFGTLLNTTEGSHFFTDLAKVTMGRFRGGAAKIAVMASALFGSVSGSAVANVVSTGVVTIPMIRKSGYPAHKAAAIESVASTGGQLMPPVMGAAAFLMAQFLQIDYTEVLLAALIPSLLYFTALFIQADLDAGRSGITRVDPAEIPKARSLLGGAFFILPFAVLLYALFVLHLRPESAALDSAGVLLVCALVFGYRGKRPTLMALLRALSRTGFAVLDIILICAAAGFVIGVLAISGLSFNLTLALVNIAAGNLALLMVLTAAVCIVLGMGLPTLGVYALLAALVAPALVEVGVPPIAAHLYVMYFGMMSMITPPVAIAAFAAAGLANADPFKTGLMAVRFGWTAYIVPFLFVLTPSLLLMGETGAVLLAVVTAIIGVGLASVGIAGYLTRPLGPAARAAFILCGLMALVPAGVHAWGLYSDLIGIGIGLLLVLNEFLAGRRLTRGQPAAPDPQ